MDNPDQRKKETLPKKPTGRATAKRAQELALESEPSRRVKQRTPAQLAIAAYLDEFAAAKGERPGVAPKDCKAMRELVETNELDPERVRAAAKVFMAIENDPWLLQVSYSLGAFVHRFQQCDLRAQKRARRAPVGDPEPEAADEADLSQDPTVLDLIGRMKGTGLGRP